MFFQILLIYIPQRGHQNEDLWTPVEEEMGSILASPQCQKIFVCSRKPMLWKHQSGHIPLSHFILFSILLLKLRNQSYSFIPNKFHAQIFKYSPSIFITRSFFFNHKDLFVCSNTRIPTFFLTGTTCRKKGTGSLAEVSKGLQNRKINTIFLVEKKIHGILHICGFILKTISLNTINKYQWASGHKIYACNCFCEPNVFHSLGFRRTE